MSTVPANIDYDAFPRMLTLNGTLANLNRRSIAGTPVGGIAETQEMLDFCAAHDIGSEVEIIGADDIDAAHDRVATGDVRHPFVIDISTMAD